MADRQPLGSSDTQTIFIITVINKPPICGSTGEVAIRRTPHRVYLDQNGQAELTCPRCQHRRILNVSQHLDAHHPLRILCRCQWIFTIQLEIPSFYLKSTRLQGRYVNPQGGDFELLTVKDISFTGINFHPTQP